MSKNNIFESERPGSEDNAWCPGCGNFGIKNILHSVLEDMGRTPQETVVISGIGQAAKMPHYINANGFHSLHGRAIPIATAAKLANPELTVIAEGGDGDMYGEGGNHMLHGMRRNADITVFAHNNQVYGLTKGQGSPTSMKGMNTPTQPHGVYHEPFNPIALALSQNIGFVARTFMGNMDESKEIFRKALEYKGFALVDIFQPCVTFNKINTYGWYKENTYTMEDHDTSDKMKAMEKAFETDKLPLGIFYEEKRDDVSAYQPALKDDKTPMFKRKPELDAVRDYIQSKRA